MIIPIILAVLIAVSVVSLTKLSDTSQKLEEQQNKTIETNERLKLESIKSRELEDKSNALNKSLEEEKVKLEGIREENQGLKVQLQAKIERESRQEPNLYGLGQCTWYVKERIPYIGGTWGNANQWLASAANYGFETGSEPKQGAIGVAMKGPYGHVVYVESITKGGLVEVSEMNYAGVGVQSTRTVEYWEFTYIYT